MSEAREAAGADARDHSGRAATPMRYDLRDIPWIKRSSILQPAVFWSKRKEVRVIPKFAILVHLSRSLRHAPLLKHGVQSWRTICVCFPSSISLMSMRSNCNGVKLLALNQFFCCPKIMPVIFFLSRTIWNHAHSNGSAFVNGAARRWNVLWWSGLYARSLFYFGLPEVRRSCAWYMASTHWSNLLLLINSSCSTTTMTPLVDSENFFQSVMAYLTNAIDTADNQELAPK